MAWNIFLNILHNLRTKCDRSCAIVLANEMTSPIEYVYRNIFVVTAMQIYTYFKKFKKNYDLLVTEIFSGRNKGQSADTIISYNIVFRNCVYFVYTVKTCIYKHLDSASLLNSPKFGLHNGQL